MEPVGFKSQTLTLLLIPVQGLNWRCRGPLNSVFPMQTSRSFSLFTFTQDKRRFKFVTRNVIYFFNIKIHSMQI